MVDRSLVQALLVPEVVGQCGQVDPGGLSEPAGAGARKSRLGKDGGCRLEDLLGGRVHYNASRLSRWYSGMVLDSSRSRSGPST